MSVTSYAQNGEDLQIAYFIGTASPVTYIDVGCLWPESHSNTYFFYERGGNGLCIDPNPTVAAEWQLHRPRDVFLNRGIADCARDLEYHTHANPVFNTFSPEVSAARVADGERRAGAQRQGRVRTGVVTVPVTTLDEAVRDTEIAKRLDGRLDVLSIDTEGFEMQVIDGFAFDELRPRLVVAEHIRRGSRRDPPQDAPLVRAIVSHGYWLAAFTGHDVYLLDERA